MKLSPLPLLPIFLVLLPLAFVASGASPSPVAVEIEEAEYEGRPHFRIRAPGATWYFDKAGGGFSRLIDRDGSDWIGFRMTPTRGQEAAAGAYRGIPNAVFGKGNPDAGAGHPGKDRCVSTLAGPDLIRTVSTSGTWAWTWRFTATHAIFTMEKADPEHPWWFLYEGPPAGRFAPRQQYWGTDLGGPYRVVAQTGTVAGHWRWVYFGDDDAPRVLFVAQTGAADAIEDSFRYMGATEAGLDAPDGMAVFGFGRAGVRPGLKGAGLEFRVGLVEMPVPDPTAHTQLADKITRILRYTAGGLDGGKSSE